MDRKMLRDDQWERIEELLPGKASDPGRTAKDNRRFVEAVLWIMRTGSPWRDLPLELGHWHRTFVRFSSPFSIVTTKSWSVPGIYTLRSRRCTS